MWKTDEKGIFMATRVVILQPKGLNKSKVTLVFNIDIHSFLYF